MKNRKDRLIDAIGMIDDRYIDEAQNVKTKRFSFSWALTGKLLTGALCLFLLVSVIPNFFRMGSSSKSEEAPMEGIVYSSEENGVVNDGIYDNEYEKTDSNSLTENKKLIVTGYMNIETLDFDSLIENLNINIATVGGYIQNSTININRNETRNYEATIRIPADKYDEFISNTKQNGNVTWYNENIDDITTTYTDLEARINSLKAEETKVMEFYDKATDLNELMSIEERLTDIRYEIDSLETQIKNYDLLTSYSTLHISVYETKAYTKTNDNFLSRLGLSFRNGFTNFINSIENLIIDIVYNIWEIIAIVIVVTILIIVVRKIKRNRK